MAVLDYETLKAFMHPSLLDSFPDNTPPDGIGEGEEFDIQNPTLKASIIVATQMYNALTASLPEGAVVRFDSVTFMLKIAFCHIYEFILHDVSYLTAITLTGLGISENQVWEHFKALLDMERKDIEDMKQDLLDEIADKENKANFAGVFLWHGRPSGGNSSRR